MNNPEENKTEEIQKENESSQDMGISESNVKGDSEVKQGNETETSPPKEKKPHTTTILEEKSVNLIPVMSREDIKKEEKKTKMNKISLLSLLVLLAISIIIIGFTIVTTIQLNHEEQRLIDYEDELALYNQIIIDNNQILQRIYLFQDVQRDRYSTTKVVDHIQNILSKVAGSSFSTFNFSGTTGINFRGECRDLEELAKLWYLLVNDPKLSNVELRSLSRGPESVSFNFEANIILDEFILLAEN